MEKIEKLRTDFTKETGDKHITRFGLPDIDYVEWLEKKLIKNHSDLSNVSVRDFKVFEAGFKAYRHNVCESKHPYDSAAECTCEIEFQKYRNDSILNDC